MEKIETAVAGERSRCEKHALRVANLHRGTAITMEANGDYGGMRRKNACADTAETIAKLIKEGGP